MVYKMETDFEFDKRIAKYEAMARIVDGRGGVVEVEKGTRIYREVGYGHSFKNWVEDLQKCFGGEVIPFEWVAQFVGVSRAALHKRVKRGGLTVLAYELREEVNGILGGKRERMRREYKVVPLSECKAWRSILLDRADEELRREYFADED